MKPRFLQTLPASGKLSGIVFFLMLGFLPLSARAQTPTHYEPTLESLNQHPLPSGMPTRSWGYLFTGAFIRFRDGLRWFIPSTISPRPTTSRTIPTRSGI